MTNPIRAALERLVEAADQFGPVGGADGKAVAAEVQKAREVLTQPAPPVEGEVGKLVAWLRMQGEAQKPGPNRLLSDRTKNEHQTAGTKLIRAADLLSQRHPAPVPVSERLPEPNTKVLAHYFNDLGKGRTICAIWVPAKSRSDEGDLDRDDFLEDDEEGDKYYWPEGWYEAIENWEELGWVKVYEGEVVYWQPLPKWPALPEEI